MPKLLFFLTLVPLMFNYSKISAQTRTFSEKPEILLGLKLDRSPSLTFVDVERDGDIGVANSDGLNGIHINKPKRNR